MALNNKINKEVDEERAAAGGNNNGSQSNGGSDDEEDDDGKCKIVILVCVHIAYVFEVSRTFLGSVLLMFMLSVHVLSSCTSLDR
jgi:hypothetical protein